MNGSDNTSQPSNSFNGFVFLSSFFLNFSYESSWTRCIKHYNDIKSNDVSVSRINHWSIFMYLDIVYIVINL